MDRDFPINVIVFFFVLLSKLHFTSFFFVFVKENFTTVTIYFIRFKFLCFLVTFLLYYFPVIHQYLFFFSLSLFFSFPLYFKSMHFCLSQNFIFPIFKSYCRTYERWGKDEWSQCKGYTERLNEWAEGGIGR